MTDSVTKTIVGRCEEIEQKPDSDWVRFNINVGTQYPVKLSTKKQAIIDAARAVGSETATWTFKESQGNENPNKPGTYFTNRYLDKVEPGMAAENGDLAGGPAPAPQQRPSEGQHAPLPIGDRERSIVRQACLKAAATLFSGMGNVETISEGERDNVSELIAAAARFENWVMRDLDDLPF